MSRQQLQINRCAAHGFWSISVGDRNSATRITPSKCCGQWTEVQAWDLASDEWMRLAAEALAAAKTTTAPDGGAGV